jgi:mitochondrial chaperone BCS1
LIRHSQGEIRPTRKGKFLLTISIIGRFQSSITLSGFLNALDGVVASEERIIFMTTNHPERLDPALIRPGRVDVNEYLGHASHYQMKEMFLRFYGGSEDRAEEFAKTISAAAPISTAFLQGLFVSNKERPEDALKEAKALKSNLNPSELNQK